MLFNRVRIQHIRNITASELSHLSQFNVITGSNGSGKSSILEAIHILATGKSFRTAQLKQYISHDQDHAVVFAEGSGKSGKADNAIACDEAFLKQKYGVQKFTNGQAIIKINDMVVPTFGEMAKRLPVQMIDPLSITLLDEGSKIRRQMFDWLLFHVKPDFYAVWLNYQKILSHRNSLLKKRVVAENEYVPWEKALAEHSLLIHTMRTEVMAPWVTHFNEIAACLLPEIEFTLSYMAGFDSNTDMLQAFSMHRGQDIERGFTWYGAHRADIRVKTRTDARGGGVSSAHAETVLSRGQKKMLILALKLSQICMLSARGKASVVLLDDIMAELDAAGLARLVALLATLKCQVFITVLDAAPLCALLKEAKASLSLFHVEQGVIQGRLLEKVQQSTTEPLVIIEKVS